MKTEYIGAFQVPDGDFGKKTIIYLCFDPQTHCCLEVHVTGFFRSCIPPATTKEEVIWLMQNHPSCKGRFKVVGGLSNVQIQTEKRALLTTVSKTSLYQGKA